MRYIKIYEDFNIEEYLDIMKPMEVEVDPYNEEDWEELEEGDMVYNVDKYMNIDIRKIKPGEKLFKYKKLTKRALIRDLIISRNLMIGRNKVKNEGIFRKINDLRKKEFDDIIKKGDVENSDKDVTLNDIKNGYIEEFIFYHIEKEHLLVDKYKAKAFYKKNDEVMKKITKEDTEGDDFWAYLMRHADDIRIETKQIVSNIPMYTLGDLFFRELEELVKKGECILESKNVEEEIKKHLSDKVDDKIEVQMKNDLEQVKKDIIGVDNILNHKIDLINKRFP
jgi:hypothetical protein